MSDIYVIIPTYKPEEYFLECLYSIENQDLDKSKFFVYIVLNGSDISYKDKIEFWLESFSFKFKIIFTENSGVSHARNLALNEIDDGCIVFIDDDDLISKNYLSSLLSFSSKNILTVSNVKSFDGEIFFDEYLTLFSMINSSNILKNRRFLSNVCCKAINRHDIANIRFNENLKYGEDAFFMFEVSKNIKKVISCDLDTIYYRRLRWNSVSRKKRSKISIIKQSTMQYKYYLKSCLTNKRSITMVLFRCLAIFKKMLIDLGLLGGRK